MTQDLGFEDDFLESMLGDFLDESDGLLEQLNENLFVLDDWVKALPEGTNARCDENLINEMFRAAHSLKGLSAMLRLDDINILTHKMENVFDAARNEQLYLQVDSVDLIFRSVDCLGAMIERLKDASQPEVSTDAIIAEIQQLLEINGAEKEMHSQDDAELAMQNIIADTASEAEAALESISQQVEQLDDEPSRDAETPVESAPTELVVDHFADVHDEADVPANYLAIFIDECDQSLDDLSDLLVTQDDDKLVESLMITCHRIKGSAASLGLSRPAKLAHLMEDVLQELLQSGADLTDEIADALLACTDALRTYVETLKQGDAQSTNFDQAYQALVKARQLREEQLAQPTIEKPVGAADSNSQTDDSRTQQTPPLSSDEIARIAEEAPADANGIVARVVFEEDLPLVELKAALVVERVSSLGHMFHCSPAEVEFDTQENFTSLTLGVATSIPAEEAQAKLDLEGVCRVDVHPFLPQEQPAAESVAEQETPSIAETTPELSKPATPPATQSVQTTPAPVQANSSPPAQSRNTAKPAETLRVDIDRLDQLMNLAGQLVINKARFVQISDGLRHLTQVKSLSQSVGGAVSLLDRMNSSLNAARREQQSCGLIESLSNCSRQLRDDLESIQREVQKFTEVRGLVGDLSEAVHQLDRAADGIQKSVMDTRMVPIGPLFGRFKRVVRDLTRGTDKEVTLEISGEKTELDKRMIDELGDPLIHMVRNSVDHGIESPANRAAAGKAACGTVNLDAFHRGNRIVIKITDDGKGIDPNKVRDKAIARGLITEADAERLTSQQIFQLIWEPGFSTAEKVTEVSGRGMGMDIVRSKIEELSGTVDLDSVPGEGTVFTIRLPLTMAILPTLLCRINGDVFAIPVESVVEIVRVQKAELSTVRSKKTATVRGRVVSVVALAEMFTWNRPPVEDFVEPDSSDVTLVVIGIDDREIGLLVHGLIGEEDIVIKSMSDNYRNVEGIAGASILGDGRVSLILDVGALLQMACRTRGGTQAIEQDTMQAHDAESTTVADNLAVSATSEPSNSTCSA